MPDSKPKYDPPKHQRKSIRLPDFDYTQASAYFVTIVTDQWACLFGENLDGVIVLNDLDRIAEDG